MTVNIIEHIFSYLKGVKILEKKRLQILNARSSFVTLPEIEEKTVKKVENIVTEKQYVAYYRVSTKKQKKSGLGLEAQRAIVEHFAKVDKAEIVKEFTEAESGKNIENREILKAAMSYCLKNKCMLIVAKLDRLSRDVEHIFQIQKKMDGLFKSCDLPNMDSLTLSIFAGLAQRERELISIRTKAALKAKKLQGAVLGNPQHLTDESRRLAIKSIKEKAARNENNKRAMSLIAKCKATEMSLTEIASELNTHGFTTSRGKLFHKTTVSRLYKRWVIAQEQSELAISSEN